MTDDSLARGMLTTGRTLALCSLRRIWQSITSILRRPMKQDDSLARGALLTGRTLLHPPPWRLREPAVPVPHVRAHG
jgi:hypothetical protein